LSSVTYAAAHANSPSRVAESPAKYGAAPNASQEKAAEKAGKMTADERAARIETLRTAMKRAAEQLDFVTAAQLRDEMLALEAQS